MANSRICAIEGCGKKHYGKGWCKMHHMRFLRHGDPLCGGTAGGDLLAFLKNVVLPFDGDECLSWPYTTNKKGYGQININGKKRIVSRIVCEIIHGPPPTPEHHAAHSCGKGHLGCVNHRHLAWKTPEENAADKLIHGTENRGARNGRAKLTEGQVLEIRASIKTHRELAAEYGIAQSTVSQIKSRKNWFWMEDAA